MKIGIIGAGRVGFSMGKYMVEQGLSLAGYFSRSMKNAKEAGTFTGTKAFQELEQIIGACDIVCIATSDDAIEQVWTQIRDYAQRNAEKQPLRQKIICHFSGSYSSDVFSEIIETGAFGCSVHPMSAFSDKFTSYKQLNQVVFTVEGDSQATIVVKQLLSSMGNQVLEIKPEQKTLYHCSASVVSNLMLGLFETGLELLEACGIPEETGRELFAPLVMGNIQSMLEKGAVQALTGPVERGDAQTVEKHLSSLEGDNREMYRLLGKKLVLLSEKKHPERDYAQIKRLFMEEK